VPLSAIPDFCADDLTAYAGLIDCPQLVPVYTGSCHPVGGVGVAAVSQLACQAGDAVGE